VAHAPALVDNPGLTLLRIALTIAIFTALIRKHSPVYATCYPNLSLVIGGRDGMDGGGGHWMSCSFMERVIHYGTCLLLNAFGGGFGWGKIYVESISLVIIYSTT